MFDEEKQQSDAVDLPGKREGYEYARLGQPQDHWHLHAVCIHLPTDYEPYGFRVRTGPDCSCGCKGFSNSKLCRWTGACAPILSRHDADC